MTIIEAINRTDNMRPNVYDQMTKIEWLSQLDGQVKALYDGYQGAEGSAFQGYGPQTPMETFKKSITLIENIVRSTDTDGNGAADPATVRRYLP